MATEDNTPGHSPERPPRRTDTPDRRMMLRSDTTAHNTPIYKQLATLEVQLIAELEEFKEVLENEVEKINLTRNEQQLATEQDIDEFIEHIKTERNKLLAASDAINNSLALGMSLIDQLTPEVQDTQRTLLKRIKDKYMTLVKQMLKQLQNMQITYQDLIVQVAEHYPDIELTNLTFTVLSMGNEELRRTPQTEFEDIRHTPVAPRSRRQSENSENGSTQNRTFATREELPMSNVMKQIMNEMRIPHYNGSPETWDEFWETFKVLVHDTNYPNIIKQTALKNCVTDKAADVVRRFKSDGSTYREAIRTLQKTFGNETTRLQAVWDKFQSVPTAKENTRSIRATYNEMASLLASLSRLDQELDTQLMILDVKKKFPRSVWTALNNMNIPFLRMDQLLDAIESHIRTQETIDTATKSHENYHSNVMNTRSYQANNTFPKKEYNNRMNPNQRTQNAPNYTRNMNQKPQFNSSYKPQANNYRNQRVQRNEQKTYCIFCAREGHKSTDCRTHVTIQAKKNALQREQRCFQCLKKGHTSRECRTRVNCKRCNATNHATIICTSGANTNNRVHNDRNTNAKPWTPRQSRQNMCTETADSQLMIAAPKIIDNWSGTIFTLNAMIDTGAENSFIREDVAKDLQLVTLKEGIEMNLILFGNKHQTMTTSQVQAILVDEHGRESECPMFLKKEITSPIQPMTLSDEDRDFMYAKNIRLNLEPGARDIHMIIGIDQFFNVVKFGQKQYTLPSGLHLVPSIFGYILCGPQGPNNETRINTAHKEKESDELEKLWKLESIGINEEKEESENDKYVLEHFDKNVQISENGEITVKLPWKANMETELGDNYKVAFRRFFQQYEAATKNPAVWETICSNFEQQEKAQIIEEAPERTDRLAYYIPYMIVTKLDSNTTKHRIVYDASSHEKGKRSLNECLHPGPVILPESPGMIMRSRLTEQLMIADVEKAFHMIRLHEDDRDVTRFIFLKDVNRPPHPHNIRIMRFTRIPFGITSSPFLLGRSIQYYVEKSQASEPLKTAINNDLYVDNLIMTFNEPEKLKPLHKESKGIFKDMAMNLREYASNCSEIQKIPEKDRSKASKQKVLGLHWDTEQDTYEIKKANQIPLKTKLTKRKAVSALAETFDPLGLFAPIYGPGKVTVQDIWKIGLEWDQEIPREQETQFREFIQKIQDTNMVVKRAYEFPSGKDLKHELIVFTDASKRLYGAVVYLRSEDENGHTTTNLIMSKSRLGTEKGLTIPRAELMSIVIGTRLVTYVEKELQLPITNITLCSDSEIALYWVKNNRSYKQFVENRVREVHKLMDSFKERGIHTEFRHVNTDQNPADHTTRTLTPEALTTSNWWKGPTWLIQNKTEWPQNITFHECKEFNPSLKTVIESEIRKDKDIRVATAKIKVPEDEKPMFNITWTNNLFKIYRMVACVLIFILKSFKNNEVVLNKLKKNFPELKDVLVTDKITGAMIEAAEISLIRQHQKQYHISENTNANLICINGLVYHNHRRGNEEDAAPERLVLKANSRLAYLIINDLHINNKHAGINTIMGLFNEKFYAPRLRNAVKSALRTCSQCRRTNNKPFPAAPVPHQPRERVERSTPFTHTALDFAGPFTVLKDESVHTKKAYIALFTCLASRLLHVEIVYSLTVDEFILALRRFFARKGCPKTIISDNATTFTLANKILGKLATIEDLQENTARERINWKFNAAYAPWQNGNVERLVGILKKALRHAIGQTTLTRTKLETLVIEAERIVNLRPLTYVNDTDNENDVIRPIDLISPKIRMPYFDPTDLEDEYHDYIESYKEVNKHVDRFWNLWKRDYLATNKVFEQTEKRKVEHSAQLVPQVDEIVLIKDENLPRYKWKMGKIISLTTGRDIDKPFFFRKKILINPC